MQERVVAQRSYLLAVALCAAVTSACAVGAGSGEGQDHPLAGRIWQVSGERFVDERDLIRDLETSRYVLLGEIHDNPAHHRLQAQILDALAASGRRPAVVLEMIPRDRADALRAALDDPAVTTQDLRRAVAWDSSGWPDWEIYAPIFESALEWGLPLVAGDLSSADRKALRGQGIAGLEPAAVRELGIDASPPDPVRTTLEASIREGHCDLLPEVAIPPMVQFQLARDAQLALALREAADPEGAVLVAGAGHVRRDAGVPFHLARFESDARVASVGLIEVLPEHSEPRSALAARFADSAPFDFVWFTPRTAREDPCEALERKLAPRDPPASR